MEMGLQVLPPNQLVGVMGPPQPNPQAGFASQLVMLETGKNAKIRRCLDEICKELNCGVAVGATVLFLLIVKLQLKQPRFAIKNDVTISKVTINKLELMLVKNGDTEEVFAALDWLVETYIEGGDFPFPSEIGGNPIAGKKKGQIGQMPKIPYSHLCMELLGVILREDYLGKDSSSSHLGQKEARGPEEDESLASGHPQPCTPQLGFPLELYHLNQIEKLESEVFQKMRQRPKKRKGKPRLHVEAFVEFFYNGDKAQGQNRKTTYRQLSYTNQGTSPVFLTKVGYRIERQGIGAFTLSDDFDLATGIDQIVRLEPKQSYGVTVIWDGSLPSGTLSLNFDVGLVFWNENDGFDTARTEVRVIDISKKSSPLEKKEASGPRAPNLDSDADVYISKALVNAFNGRPNELSGYDSPPLISCLISLGLLVKPSAHIIAMPFKSYSATYQDFILNRITELTRAAPQMLQSGFVSVRRFYILQEIKEMNNFVKYSMFHVQMKVGRINFAKKRYSFQDKDKSFPYSGPNLKGILNENEMKCVLVDLPGLPEKEPPLRTGSLVYIRPAKPQGSSLEFVAIFLASHACTAILLASQKFFELLPRTKWHIQFACDHEEHTRMHACLNICQQMRMIRNFDLFHSNETSSLGSYPSSREGRVTFEDFLATPLVKESPLTCSDVLSASPDELDKMQQEVIFKVWSSLEFGRKKIFDSQNRIETGPWAEGTDMTNYNIIRVEGPAGTGKSLTATSAAALISIISNECDGKNEIGCRILICTPEEYTADLICVNLHRLLRNIAVKTPSLKMDKDKLPKILRVNDPRRPVSHSHVDALVHCEINDYGVFEQPSRKDLASAQIVVCSCKSSFLLHDGSLEAASELNFDLCIIDEVGQASVPDFLASLSCIGSTKVLPSTHEDESCMFTDIKKTVLVLGDKYQLGPNQSAMFRPVLDCLGGDLIQLRRNYRSNAGLLDIPKALFYGSSLDTGVPEEEVTPPDISGLGVFKTLKERTSGQAPASVVALGVDGEHARASIWARGRSCFNKVEAETMRDICLEFVEKRVASTAQISIVALSRAQVVLIRDCLRSVHLSEIRVGTVDDFQGQQSDVILISCVGSSTQALDLDEKRFNVAITRARRLLIVVGNAKVLQDAEAGPWYELARICDDRDVLLRWSGAPNKDHKDNNNGSSSSNEGGYESDNNSRKDEQQAMSKLTCLAKSALLGSGDADSIFPEHLSEHNLFYGWSAAEDDTAIARIQLD